MSVQDADISDEDCVYSSVRGAIKKILVARADFEKATYILADFVKEFFIDLAQAFVTVKDLYGAKDTRLNFANALTDKGVESVLVAGHGDYTIVTGQNYDILWQLGMDLRSEVEGRDIVTISCRCGRDLGKYIIQKGAKMYKGYKESFVLLYGGTEPPSKDAYAELFIKPALLRAKYLYDNRITSEECEDEANELSKREIEQWKKINPQVADIINYDMNIQVFYKQEQENKSLWEKILDFFKGIWNWIKSWL